ncbi:MAG: heparinase II/III family protein [Rhodospirillales bacterium]
MKALARLIFASPLHRLLLSGGVPAAPTAVPNQPPRGSAARGRRILAGDGLPDHPDWQSRALDPATLAALNGFGWLADLAAVGTPQARGQARRLIGDWLEQERWHPGAWAPEIIGRRITIALETWSFVIEGAGGPLPRRWLASLSRQARHLARHCDEGADGLPRLEAATGLLHATLAGLGALDLAATLDRLQREIARQILPDGGHVERSPAAHAEALDLLVGARDTLTAAGVALPARLEPAIERMCAMTRFFRHGDGRLALFNGSGEGDGRALDRLLQRAGAKAAAPDSAPDSGFERLARHRTLAIFNTGAPPPRGLDGTAHAGQLSFELSLGRERIVVNCGGAPGAEPAWSMAARATAAHSTMTVDETNSAELRSEGGMVRRPRRLECHREEADGAVLAAASHDGYAPNFGLTHRRRLWLSPDGTDLRGEDVLAGPHAGTFRARFHLHPDMQTSLIQNGGAALLRAPSGTAWRFSVAGGRLDIAESAYFGSAGQEDLPAVRRSEQLVVSGPVADGQPLKWAFRMLPRG